MKLLRIVAQGLPLFREELDIVFYAQQRVGEEDRETLFPLTAKPNVFLHTTNAFIGINASGKTSVLKVIQLALSILNNEPINHVETRSILGSASKAVLRIYFYDAAQKSCCLETEITTRTAKQGSVCMPLSGKLCGRNR